MMRDDFEGLRRSLESGVNPPPFEMVSQRADATIRRRRTRTVVLASAGSAAAIVIAAVALTTLPRDEPQPYADASRERQMPPPGATIDAGLPAPEITVDATVAEGGVAIALATDGLRSQQRVFIQASNQEGERFQTAIKRAYDSESGWTYAGRDDACRALGVDVRAGTSTITLPSGCVAHRLTADSTWRLVTETSNANSGWIYTTRVTRDGRNSAPAFAAKQWRLKAHGAGAGQND